jgi:plastocyanin
MRIRSLVVAAITVVLLAACSGGDSTVVEGQDVVVHMYDNRFEFTEVRIPVGGTVTWQGAGRNPHNAVASDGSWSTEDEFGSLEMLDGDSAALTYDTPGTFEFYCTIHGNTDGDGMAGTLVVGET